MVQKISEVMSSQPVMVSSSTPVVEAARLMREKNIGDVIVTEDEEILGIATDRDIVVRGIAEGLDPLLITLGQICSRDPVVLKPEDSSQKAIQLMRDNAIRRIPIVEKGKPVGIVSLGDLAVEKDRKSVLADISAAKPNN